MAKPVIAITGPKKGAFGPRFLVALVVRFYGGIPLQLFPGVDISQHQYNGVVITGGHDINPTLYASEPEIEVIYDSERDNLETLVIKKAIRENLPLLGICRGAQLLNICCGGSLYKDLKSIRKISSHRWTILPLKTLCVENNPDSLNSVVKKIFGTGHSRINSLHNQGVERLGEGLSVTARDLDNIIQAVEDPTKRFLVGVQWHPEFLLYMNKHRALFRELIKEC
jgi:putative glutamine amidotransferase